MKKIITIILAFCIFSISVNAAKPYNQKKGPKKTNLRQSPTFIVPDDYQITKRVRNASVIIPRTNIEEAPSSIVEIEATEIVKPKIVKPAIAVKINKEVSTEVLSIVYIPSKRDLKKAERLKKKQAKSQNEGPAITSPILLETYYLQAF